MHPDFTATELLEAATFGLDDVVSVRAALAELIAGAGPLPRPAGLTVLDRTAPGPAGCPQVPIRVYRRDDVPAAAPALVYLHGGSFAVGDLDFEDAVCVRYALDVGCVVVSVDYRLAPEHPFPAGVEDAYAVTRWVADAGAAELGVDPARVAVGGASAGGGLAAAVALMARDRGAPALAFQLLLYPPLDDRLATASIRRFTDTPVYTGATAARMWELYLGSARDDVSPYAAPLRAPSLRGLPPAFVSLCGLDPLRDEGLAYAARLLEDEVPVELHLIPGVPHGFDAFPGVLGERAREHLVAALRAGLR